MKPSTQKCTVFLLAALGLAACSVLPKSAPQLVQHDLGSIVPVASRKSVPLRLLTVTAAPVVSGLSMYYRDAVEPTHRGVYAYNRWAAAPASLVENALVRLLPQEAGGRCRLVVHLSDLIVETASGTNSGVALLAAELQLSADQRGTSILRVVDLRIPLAEVSPAAAAHGLREAVLRLGDEAAEWIGTQGGLCSP